MLATPLSGSSNVNQIYHLFHHDGDPYHIETSPLIWFLNDRNLRHERNKGIIHAKCVTTAFKKLG